MKRMRTVDVPKFRRPLKNRTRLGESVYFRFFSLYNLVYLKFVMMWLGCIALDFIIGFRFELLWPVWLLVRHLYESFRVHAFSSSLHYSAFSVFFVCVTATSDLVCYLFIPLQVLLFIASTYVWVQFVYQSTDRGICFPSLLLWTLFLVFEYFMRYRFDNATWYLARTSWLTAGLFPSTADSVSIGSGGNSSPPSLSPRLELYRPFAAHCIGFPVVTLGFRVKSFFNKWRMKVRREEVKRQNMFFERLLAEAIPTTFENRQHFISSRRYSSLAVGNGQEMFENDGQMLSSLSSMGGGGGGDSLGDLPSGKQHLYNQMISAYPLAICGNQSGGNTNSSSSTVMKKSSSLQQQKVFAKAGSAGNTSSGGGSGSSSSILRQNGQLVGVNNSLHCTGNGNSCSQLHNRRNGSLLLTLASGSSNSTTKMAAGFHSRQEGGELISYSSEEHTVNSCRTLFVVRLFSMLLLFAYTCLQNIHKLAVRPLFDFVKDGLLGGDDGDGDAVEGLNVTLKARECRKFSDTSSFTSLEKQRLLSDDVSNEGAQDNEVFGAHGVGSANGQRSFHQQDDMISVSGDGSHVADDYDETDQEERLSNNHTSSGPVISTLNGVMSSANNYATSTTAVANNKKKAKRARGKTMENKDGINSTKFSSLTNSTSSTNNVFCNGGTVVVSHAESASSSNAVAVNGGTSTSADVYSNCNGSDVSSKVAELKQAIKDKELLETAVEKLSNELKGSKSELSEMRNQMLAFQQQEKTFKQELLVSKTKVEQAECKWKQVLKQNEHFKSVIGSNEKRIGELQARKLELERDLANERHNNAAPSKKEDSTKSHGHPENYGGHFKTKVFDLERELKSLRRELRNKDELNAKIEEDVKKLRLNSANKQSDEETYAKQIEFLHQKNYILEQTLSSENRLKQDLFRALNDSKAQIETLNVRLRCYERAAMDGGAMAPSGSCEMNGKFGSLSDLHQQQQLSPRQLQSVPLSSISSYSTSVTPPSMTVASTLNLDQLMQATGAQHMSYSFAPFDTTCSNGNGSNYLKNGNTNAMLDVGGMNGGGGAYDTFGDMSSSSSGGGKLLTIGSHRHSGCNNSNNINSASSFPQQSLVNNTFHQQQQYHSSSDNNKCSAQPNANVNSPTTTAKSC